MKIIFGVLSFAFYLTMAILAYFVVNNASLAAKYSLEVNKYSTLEERLDTEFKVLLDNLSFGVYDGGEEKTDSIELSIAKMESFRQKLNLYSFILLAMSVFLLLISWLFFRKYLFQHLLILSLIALVVGLLTPVLSFVAFQDLPVLGQVVFKYDSRGILGSIRKLLEFNSFFVAALLFLFSVIVPFIKLALSFFMMLDSNSQRAKKISRFLHGIGKWSMLDVFVVAVFLPLFALGKDGLSDARAGIGLYFFASYVLFSMLSSQAYEHINKK